MSTDPRADRQERRPAAPLGFPRSAAELDPRIDPSILTAISRIAPGTPLRQGIDDIIRAREGALIVIGEPSELSFLSFLFAVSVYTPKITNRFVQRSRALTDSPTPQKLYRSTLLRSNRSPDPVVLLVASTVTSIGWKWACQR